ncbi:MAG: S8 family serine peptidase [Thermoanaerobaculia bacterium]|nr:S8 family serine peptidase [Thermoanaerobaculia bacterium]
MRTRTLPALLALPLALSVMAPALLSADAVVTLRIENTRPEAAEAARRAGLREEANYGAFSYWKAPEHVAKDLLASPEVSLAAPSTSLELRRSQLDTRASMPVPPASAGFHIVHFPGPVRDAWLQKLSLSGARPVLYIPENGYLVWIEEGRSRELSGLGSDGEGILDWYGPYTLAHRLHPTLDAVEGAAPGPVAITVQLYAPKASSLGKLMGLTGNVLVPPNQVLDFLNVSLEVPADRLQEIAGWPDVYNVEPYVSPRLNDEIQAQIVAGNVTASGANIVPSSAGYLTWVGLKEFPASSLSYPIVDFVDDGLDNGSAATIAHPDFRELGNAANASRVVSVTNCTPDSSAASTGGHGTLNAGIGFGYNNQMGFPFTDGSGYRLGLGVSPYGRIGATKIFRSSGLLNTSACGGTYQGVVASSYNKGAAISSNSWGAPSSGGYDALAQTYDALTRDAMPGTDGLQEMLHIFSAGNSGPGSQTIGSPGSAKNVVTVGASENVRSEGIADACAITAANNADDIISFSSRGPTADLRTKPDMVAPGTHVQGPASQTSSFMGNGLCVSPSAPYFPAGQTLYTWSSGTSHAAPAVTGMASLLYSRYELVLNPGNRPSPAMLKALLILATRNMSSPTSGGNMPNGSQGWGSAALNRLIDGAPIAVFDQARTLAATGESFSISGTVSDPTKPLRIVLTWTDAPGSTTSASYVNNLDLEVEVNSQIYKGNVFANAVSVTGGSFDTRNNVEAVFLPVGTTGPYIVRVKAANIAGDGIPGNADTTDQDFAIAVYNGEACDAPSTEITAPAQVCAGSSENAASVPEGADIYSWSITNGTIEGPANTPAITFTAGLTGPVSLSVTVTKAGCRGAATKSVPLVSAAITAPSIVCTESTGNTASGLPDADSYTWTITNGTITSGAGTKTIVFTAGTSGTIQLGLTVTKGNCTVASSKSISINATPPSADITAPAEICAGSPSGVASVAPGADTYLWTVTNGRILGGQGTPTLTYLAGGPGTLALSATVAKSGCTVSKSVEVNVVSRPGAAITAPQLVCPGAEDLEASAPAGFDTYNWAITNGTITAGGTAKTVTFDAGTAGTTTLTLTATKNGCTATTSATIQVVAASSNAPVLTSPAPDATGFTGGALTWTHPDANLYEVLFDTVNPPQRRLTTTQAKSAYIPVWFPGTTYYWQVKALSGCGTKASEIASFTTGTCPWAAISPSLVSPAPGASSQPTELTLQWSPVLGTAYYAISLGVTATGLKRQRTVPAGTTAVTIRLNPGTTYYWSVTAFPVCGSLPGATSLQQSFSTAAASGSVLSIVPGTLERYSSALVDFYGNNLLPSSKTFIERSGVAAGVLENAVFTTTQITQYFYSPSPRPAGFYDAGLSIDGVEKSRLLRAVALRAFTDVGENEYFFESSSQVVDTGLLEPDFDAVAAGPQFAPTTPVTRGLMALYLARAYQWWRTGSTSLQPATCTDDGQGGSTDFTDVPCTHPLWLPIHWIKTWGVTVGSPCPEGPGLCYLPERTLNRAEAITFLQRLKQGTLLPSLLAGIGEIDPGCTEPYPACSGWTDAGMKTAGWPRREINVAFNDRMTVGCGGSPGNNLTMCVYDPLNRAQTGELLARTLVLVPNP